MEVRKEEKSVPDMTFFSFLFSFFMLFCNFAAEYTYSI